MDKNGFGEGGDWYGSGMVMFTNHFSVISDGGLVLDQVDHIIESWNIMCFLLLFSVVDIVKIQLAMVL